MGDQVLDDGHVRQWVDAHRALDVLDRLEASQRIGAVDVHCAGTANPFAARAAERQGRIDLVLDLDQRVENHRTAVVEVDLERVDHRVLPVVGVPAVDLELAQPGGAGLPGESLTDADFRVPRQSEFGHRIPYYTRALCGKDCTSFDSV